LILDSSDPKLREQTQTYRNGVEYLCQIESRLPDPRMVDVMANLRDRVAICNWIGGQIEAVNTLLRSHVETCHQCFDIGDRREIEIFAVPLADALGLDGFCNITTVPTTILIDVGRVAQPDWLALVAHEYAHAHLGCPGHDRAFADVLSHLCLGLGFAQPHPDHQCLNYWPPYPHIIDPLAWWRGGCI
jgi:hypothetical protein